MYRILFPVRKRIHCGIGLFCFATCASFFLMMVVLWDGWSFFFFFFFGREEERRGSEVSERERESDERSQRGKELVFLSPAFRNGARAASDRTRAPNVRPRRILVEPARFESKTRHERQARGRRPPLPIKKKASGGCCARPIEQRASSIDASRGPGEACAASFSRHGDHACLLV